MAAKFDLAVSSRERERSCSSLDFIDRVVMGFRLLLLKVMADGAIANMSESGFKVDPSFVHSLKLPKTNSMVAKSAREKRRKIIADKKVKRCRACDESNSNGVSLIKDPMVTQIAREKRRQIIAAKKAMRCTTSNGVLSNSVQSSQQTKSKGGRNSRLNGEKLSYTGSTRAETTSR